MIGREARSLESLEPTKGRACTVGTVRVWEAGTPPLAPPRVRPLVDLPAPAASAQAPRGRLLFTCCGNLYIYVVGAELDASVCVTSSGVSPWG